VSRQERQQKRNKRNCTGAGLIGLALLSVTSILLLLGVGIHTGIAQAVESRILPEGTYIDGVYVGGATIQEAYEKVNLYRQFDVEDFSVTIKGADIYETWDAEDVGLQCDFMSIIEQAAHPGGVTGSIDEYAAIDSDREYHTTNSLDDARVAALIQDVAAGFDQAPVDAQASFNKFYETFSFTEEVSGRKLDQKGIAEAVSSQFDPYDLSPIEIDLDKYVLPVQAAVSLEDLRANCVLISECVTRTTNNPDRNVNITLMCEAADGLCLMPGEQLSLNDLVGQRTVEKGFRYSDAIIDGKIESDVGGGICQMAGTLYNAALMADIEIVERVKHTYPSTYLPIGLDATLNWDNKDLVIANDTSYPLYISTKFDNNTVTARLYGRPLSDGMSIRLRSEVLATTDPGNEEIVFTRSLPAGKRRVKQTALDGYEVEVFKEFWQDGTMLYDEQVSHDYYQPRNAIVLEGSGTDK